MVKRPSKLPIIVLTGASGIIGHHFIKAFRDDAYIYAIARRSQKEAGVEMHKNVLWMRIDIAIEDSVERAFKQIASQGGADFLIHLAGYYDFINKDHPEFERTNINGTRLILKYTPMLNIKRFIFASSITVTKFRTTKDILTEESPADATFPYARSKRKSEDMLRSDDIKFPVTIVRLAAVFSDWCEYGPLYTFLSTWLSHSWKSRILAGRGNSAIPYIHVRNLNSFLAQIIRKTNQLPDYHILIAGSNGFSTHKELYDLSVRYNFGFVKKPFFIPKWFAYLGVAGMNLIGKALKLDIFEKPWMIHYIDTQMNIDSSYSQTLLNWEPIPRYHVMRRLLFLIENMKTDPYRWDQINYLSIHKRSGSSPNLLIYEKMLTYENEIISGAVNHLMEERNKVQVLKYQQLGEEELRKRLQYLFNIVKTAVRTGDRLHALEYARRLAVERFAENFEAQDVKNLIDLFGTHIYEYLSRLKELQKVDGRINDEITMTIRLICDEVEDSYERIMGEM